MPDNTLTSLKRKLARWELEHLRQHAAELAERLEKAERDRDYYRDVADGWWQTHMDLLDQLQDDGAEIGLDKAGQIHVITPPEAA